MVTIQFNTFDFSFIFFIAMSHTIRVTDKQINRSGACYFLHASVASRCILVLFELYERPKKGTHKSSCNTFSMYISRKNWMKCTLFLSLETVSRDTNILPQMHWTSNNFGHSGTTIGGFWVSLNYPILNFKKTVCPKNIWMWHYRHQTSGACAGVCAYCRTHQMETTETVYIEADCDTFLINLV